jgi:2-polyprenyl-6-methoxyphenol hydroxylase-like FAD-dependent oxidoreductase
MGSSNFKVIVVGGGPVGLTAAHALTRANIDFVLLESRPSVVFAAGAGLVLLPIGMRVLAQLGLLDALDRVSSPLGQVERIDHQGQSIGDHQFFLHFNTK